MKCQGIFMLFTKIYLAGIGGGSTTGLLIRIGLIKLPGNLIFGLIQSVFLHSSPRPLCL